MLWGVPGVGAMADGGDKWAADGGSGVAGGERGAGGGI